MRVHLAWALVRAGEPEKARRELEALDAVAASTFVSPCQRAAVLGALGDLEVGLARFEEGIEQRDPWAVFAGAAPLLAPFRAEPRFRAFLRRVGVPSSA